MPTDEQLLKRITERDERAFDALFERHHDQLRSRLLAMVHDEAAADDLVQEVFLRVWTRAGQYSGAGSVRGWLLRVATNLALNRFRDDGRRRGRPLEGLPGPRQEEDDSNLPGWMIDAASLAPDLLAQRAERDEMFARLIASLPDEKRRVVRMVHAEQMPLQQVAEELGIPLGTVKSRLHEARRRLAAAVKELNLDWESY